MVKKKSRNPLTSTTPARSEVLPVEEPPDPLERSPDKDPRHSVQLMLQEELQASALASGDECHVTTEVQAEIPNSNIIGKGKARASLPQQYKAREFLSPRQTRTVVAD